MIYFYFNIVFRPFQDCFVLVPTVQDTPKTSLPSFNYPFLVTFHFFYYFSTSNTVLYCVGNKAERILALFILSSNEVKRCLFQLLFTSCTMYFLFFSCFSPVFPSFLWYIKSETKFRGQQPCLFRDYMGWCVVHYGCFSFYT